MNDQVTRSPDGSEAGYRGQFSGTDEISSVVSISVQPPGQDGPSLWDGSGDWSPVEGSFVSVDEFVSSLGCVGGPACECLPEPTKPATIRHDPALVTNESVTSNGYEIAVTWTTTAPDGFVHQVYVDRRLAWSGSGTSCHLPQPTGRADIDVIAVPASAMADDFSGQLPPPSNA